MEWIKQNPAQLILGIAAAALIGVSVKLALDAQGFPEKFAPANAAPSKSRKIPKVETGPIEDAKKHLASPNQWTNKNHSGLLFTSEKYFVDNGRLVKVNQGTFHDYLYPEKEIKFQFFEEYGLPISQESIVTEDSDGDGFLNADEWRESETKGSPTDPTKKESHPAYHTRLWLAQWVKVPFRLKFQAYDGDPKRPETMSFQINTLDLRSPTEFPKIGDTIAKIFKIKSFEFKEVLNQKIGEKEDRSELTLVNTETNEEVILILNQIVDSPNQFARFEYWWGKKPGDKPQVFDVPKLKEFVLLPEADASKKYKLLDVDDTKALIQTPQGEKVTILHYPPNGKR